MEEDRFFCVNENDVERFRVARQGSSSYVNLGRLIDPEASRSQQAIVVVVDVPPLQQTLMPPHFHREYEETMYLVEGRGLLHIGTAPDAMRSLPIRPGSCCYVPAGYYHRLEVNGDRAMKLVCSYFAASGGHGKSHREISTELTSLPLEGKYGENKG